MNASLRVTAPATLVALLLVSALPGAGAAARQAAGDPAIVYRTESEVVVSDAHGEMVRTFPAFVKFSLNAGVLAGEVEGNTAEDARIVAFDAASGDRLFRIPEARLPVVTGNGRKVAFFPTFDRDPYTASVWMRAPGGKVRKVVAFWAGRGSPGIRHGMEAGATPLDVAFDDAGRKMAVVGGLETVRAFDVWLVDVRTREATRMTRGENSHNPSLSPAGTRLAVRVERPEPCPDERYGEILIGKIAVIDTATGARTASTQSSCDVFYDTPRWVDEDSLAAVRVTKDDSEELGYDLDVVRIDAATGAISDVVTEGNPCCLSASPALGVIAYAFSDRGGLAVFDLASGTVTNLDGDVFVPHVSGENRL